MAHQATEQKYNSTEEELKAAFGELFRDKIIVRTKEFTLARQMFEKVLALEPENEDAKLYLRYLSQLELRDPLQTAMETLSGLKASLKEETIKIEQNLNGSWKLSVTPPEKK